MPFLALIEDTDASAVGVMHIGKGGGQGRRPLQQLLGSTAFGAIARVVWMTGELPEDAQPPPGEDGIRDTRKILGIVKSNVSIRPPALEWSRPLDGPIRWFGESKHSIDDVLSGTAGENPIDTAKAFLLEELKGGSKAVNDLIGQAKDLDISEKTLRRAKYDLGVAKFKETGSKTGRWFWKLPNTLGESLTVATFSEGPEPEHGHIGNVAMFPDSSEDGHFATSGHLQDPFSSEQEDGQHGHIGDVATFSGDDWEVF